MKRREVLQGLGLLTAVAASAQGSVLHDPARGAVPVRVDWSPWRQGESYVSSWHVGPHVTDLRTHVDLSRDIPGEYLQAFRDAQLNDVLTVTRFVRPFRADPTTRNLARETFKIVVKEVVLCLR